MSAERRADVPAPRAGPRSLSLAWVEREEGCNKVREFRWLSSKGSLTTSPLLVCPSLFLLSLSLSLPCLSASENQSAQKQPCSVPPPSFIAASRTLPPSTPVSRRDGTLCRSSACERGEESSSDGDFHHATGIGAQLSTFDTRTDRDCQAQWLKHVDQESSHRPPTTSFAASAGAGACECSPSRHGSDGTRCARVGGVIAASRAGTKAGAAATTAGGGRGHDHDDDERGGR